MNEFNFEAFKTDDICNLQQGKGISGKGNVLLPMNKYILEEGLNAELDLHMQEERYPHSNSNRKNDATPKTATTSVGNFTLDTPRYRKSNYKPQLVENSKFI